MKNQPPTRTPLPVEPDTVPTSPTFPSAYDDETLLARWLSRAADKGAMFWSLVGGAAVATAVVGYLASGLVAGKSAGSKAWADIMLANSPEDLRRVAAANDTTLAAGWALMSAANGNYADALTRLPGDRETALPLLTQAYDTYKGVGEAKESDDLLRRMAGLGMARCLEARGELSDAIALYEKVAKDWPGTADSKFAEGRVKLLNEPASREFYVQFTAYKPKPSTGLLPPRGSEKIDRDAPFGAPIPAGHPPMDGPLVPAPALKGTGGGAIPEIPLLKQPEAPATPKPAGVPAGAVPSGDMPRTPPAAEVPKPAPANPLPGNPFQNTPGPAPLPPAEAPKAQPPAGELPSDPFPK